MQPAAIYLTRVFFFWWTQYTTGNKNLLGICAVVSCVTIRTKKWFLCSLHRVRRFLLFERVKPCMFYVVVSVDFKRKMKERESVERETKLSCVAWIGGEEQQSSLRKMRYFSSSIRQRQIWIDAIRSVTRLRRSKMRCFSRIFIITERDFNQRFLWKRSWCNRWFRVKIFPSIGMNILALNSA